MCLMKSPSMPTVADPVKPQEAKQPAQGAYGSTSTTRKDMQNAPGAMAASTLLTSPSGIDNSQLRLNRSTLLGA